MSDPIEFAMLTIVTRILSRWICAVDGIYGNDVIVEFDRGNREPVGIRISGVGAPERRRANCDGILSRLCAGGSSGHPGHGRIYMAAIYAKSRVDSLSAADNNLLAKIAAQIKKGAKEGERS